MTASLKSCAQQNVHNRASLGIPVMVTQPVLDLMKQQGQMTIIERAMYALTRESGKATALYLYRRCPSYFSRGEYVCSKLGPIRFVYQTV